MGDQSVNDEARVSGFYGTAFIIVLTLVGMALVAGAGVAVADDPGNAHLDAEHTELATTASTDAATEPLQMQLSSAQPAHTADSIEVTDTEVEVEVLTAQVGDVEAPRDPLEVALVPEQSFANHEHWGTYYPASNTIEHIYERTDILDRSTAHELNQQSWTAIGDLLGLNWEIRGVYDFGCEIDEAFWFWEDDEPWCGWHDDMGEPDGEMYHIDADTTISILEGMDVDQDNSHYNEQVLTENSLDGEFRELPTADSGLLDHIIDWFANNHGVWAYTDDLSADAFVDEAPAYDNAIDVHDLNYIEFRNAADVWGFQAGQTEEDWLRIRYGEAAWFSDVENTYPTDPQGYRYHAMNVITQILSSDAGDRVSVIGDGTVEQSLGDTTDAQVVIDEFLAADDILAQTAFNPNNGLDLEDARAQIDDEYDHVDVDDTIEFNTWESLDRAGDVMEAADPDADQAIVLLTSGQEPLRPADEWYENLADDVLDAIPDWITDYQINPERPGPDEVGSQMDQEVIQLAQEIEQQTDAEVYTLGIGAAHDGYRLASIADATSEDSDCLANPYSDSCNYRSVSDIDSIHDELLDMLIEGDIHYNIDRNQISLSAVAEGETVMEMDGINDPDAYQAEETVLTHSDTASDVPFGSDVSFELEIDACDGTTSTNTEELDDLADELGIDRSIQYNHHLCNAGETIATVEDNYVFTDGDDLSAMADANGGDWTYNPAEYLEKEFPQYVDESSGTLELDWDEDTEEAIVVIPVDENPTGYVMVHAEYDAVPDSTHFNIDDMAVAGSDEVAYVDDGTDVVVFGVGDEITVEYDVTNHGSAGEEMVVLEAPDGAVLESTSYTLDNAETASGTLTWEPGPGDVGTVGPLNLSTQNDDASSPVWVDVREPGTDIQLSSPTVDDDDKPIQLDLTTENTDPETVPEGSPAEPVTIEVNVANHGPDMAEDALVVLEIGDGELVTSEAADIGAFGWDGLNNAPADNATFEFEWTPGPAIVDEIDSEGHGEIQIQLTASSDHDSEQRTVTVEYEVDDLDIAIEDEDIDEGDLEPVDVDIDEIEIEN